MKLSAKDKVMPLLILLALALFSCGNEGEVSEDLKIARVYDKYLYGKDIEGLVYDDVSEKDSADIVNRYIEDWIRKQLLLREAEREGVMDEEELQQRIQDYKYQLLVYAFEKQYISEKLDTADITDNDIQAYYQEHSESFFLRRDIVKAYFLQAKQGAPNLDKVRRWIKSNKSDDIDNFKSYCYGFAENFSLKEDWVDLSDLTAGTPFQSLKKPNKGLILEDETEEHIYFLRILDCRNSSESAPIEYVKPDIINVLVNRRKVELQRELEGSIYRRAEKNNDFDVYK